MTSTDQIQKRIEFFGKSSLAKEQIAKSENDRIKLEIELNKLINSDQAAFRNKAIKLKTYYTNLCDSEEKSMKRNQYLLSELQRVDTHFHQLEVKLDRLDSLKKECEAYLRTAYPKWTHENNLFQINNDPYSNNIINSQIRSPRVENSTSPSLVGLLNSNNNNNNIENQGDISLKRVVNLSETIDGANNTIKSLIFGPSSLQMQRSGKKEDPNSRSPTKERFDSISDDYNKILEAEKEKSNEFIKNLITSIRNETRNELAAASNNQLMHNSEQNNLKYTASSANVDNKLLQEYEKELKRQDLNTAEFSLTGSMNFEEREKLKMNTLSTMQINSQNFDEKPRAQSTGNANEIVAAQTNAYQNSLRQELTLNAFYYLIDYIELQIAHTIHPENYYRQLETHYKNKLEIIKIALDHKSLDDMNPADVSMVVLDEIPVIIQKYTQNKCIFSQDLLGLSVTDINESTVMNHLSNATDKFLFSRLLKHWTFLKKFAFMDVNTLANIFGPSLITNGSVGQQKAVRFVEKLISNQTGSNSNLNYHLNLANLTDTISDLKSLTETSINQELLAASNSKLKESNFYQDFINSTQSSNKSKQLRFADDKIKKKNIYNDNDNDDDDDDENGEIDALVAPPGSLGSTATNSGKVSNKPILSTNPIAAYTNPKSPRREGDFDFSQSSTTESNNKMQASLKNSLRLSADKKQIPVYLRDPDSDDDSSNLSDNGAANSKKKSVPKNDADSDFYDLLNI